MNHQNFNIQFLGGTGTVTGSKYLVQVNNLAFLVDCGLFQGIKKLRNLNWEYLPIQISNLNFVILTHGHLDHCGYLPRLLKTGFRGKIFGTPPTLDITELVLKDSAKIQEEDAERANKYGYSKHKKAEPLYTLEDVSKVLNLFQPVESEEIFAINDNLQFQLIPNGHILGSSYLKLQVKNPIQKTIIFSGDLGRPNDLLLPDPKKPSYADVMIVESTYGDRLHSKENLENKLSDIVLKSIQKKGTLFIPSFAVERTQVLMYILWKLRAQNKIPKLPMIMDSPMAKEVLFLFVKYNHLLKISIDESNDLMNQFIIVDNFLETLKFAKDDTPKIIIAGSGMLSGGRMLTYLEENISKPEHTIIIAGFQASGTRGRQLLNGAEEIKFRGKYFKVRAKIENLQGLSAHGDQKEILNWMDQIKNKPENIFITHGEPQASDGLRVRIQDTYNWNPIIPEMYEIYDL